jgi:hypothetical protein
MTRQFLNLEPWTRIAMLQTAAPSCARALRRALVLPAVALLLATCASAHADNMAAINLPQPLPRPGKIPPWLIQVDSSGIDGQAFRGVKITVATDPRSGPTSQDHSLRVVLCPNGHSDYSYDEKVTAFIDVPAGVSSVDAIIDVPQRQSWNVMHVQFFEDGAPLKNYEATVSQARAGARSFGGDDSVGVLVIDSDAPTRDEYRALMTSIASAQSPVKNQHKLPDVRWLLGAIPSNQIAGNTVLSYTTEKFDDAQLLQTYAGHGGMDLLPPSELSASWLAQSNADLVVISLDDLALLNARHAEQHQALQQWLMAGGSLVVLGCGDDWERLPDLRRLAGLPDDKQLPGESALWRLPLKSKFHPLVDGMLDQNQGAYTYVQPNGSVVTSSSPYSPAMGNPGNGTTAVPQTSDWETPPFALTRCGLGAVVAYKSDNPFPGVPSDWGGLWNTLESKQFLWSRRHGMSHHQENPDFWNFVIPGVGEAPVFSFMTMIALFMLLIGPANYYYLNRWRRLSLLLVTVPLGAGIFTAGLFAFALLSDGFSTRTRVRSYTVLEPAAGLAASVTRQTYYTAFVPSDGLRYPSDTAIYPLHYSPTDVATSNYYFYQSDSQWVDRKLQLQRRYLTAREHRQFISVRSAPCQARLEVRSAGGKMHVKNLLGANIDIALLIGDDGRLHSVENLAANAQAEAPPVEAAIAISAWHKRLDPKLPTMPISYDPTRYDSLFSRGRYNRYSFYGRNQSQWGVTQGASVLERGINDIDPILNRLRDGVGKATAGYERTFTAITTDSIKADDGEPLAPLGVRNSRVVESLHVVRGRW